MGLEVIGSQCLKPECWAPQQEAHLPVATSQAQFTAWAKTLCECREQQADRPGREIHGQCQAATIVQLPSFCMVVVIIVAPDAMKFFTVVET
jgi:hypothetical protein